MDHEETGMTMPDSGPGSGSDSGQKLAIVWNPQKAP